MPSGGSLMTKLPSLTSMSSLMAQPPASSLKSSSKTTELPSQASAAKAEPPVPSTATRNNTIALVMSDLPAANADLRRKS